MNISYRASLLAVATQIIAITLLYSQSIFAAQVGAPTSQTQPIAAPVAAPMVAPSYSGSNPLIVVTQPPASSDPTKDNLATISTLVTLYYSAALLIGIAVAFLGWRSIRDLREKATEVASEVLAEREKELGDIESRLTELSKSSGVTITTLSERIEEVRALLTAQSSIQQIETNGVDVEQIWLKARSLSGDDRAELLSLIISRKLKGSAGAFHNAGTSATFIGQHRLGLQIYEQGLSDFPNDTTLLVDAGDTAAHIGDFEKAEKLFEQAIQIAPSDSRVWEFYADYWHKYRDNPHKAIDILEPKLSQLQPTAGLMREVGVIYQELGKPEKAEEYYRKGLLVEADDHLLLNRLGLLLRSMGRLEESAKLLRSASIYSHGHGNQPNYLVELGTTLFELARYEDALKAFLSARPIVRSNIDLWIHRCEVEIEGRRLLSKAAPQE